MTLLSDFIVSQTKILHFKLVSPQLECVCERATLRRSSSDVTDSAAWILWRALKTGTTMHELRFFRRDIEHLAFQLHWLTLRPRLGSSVIDFVTWTSVEGNPRANHKISKYIASLLSYSK